MRFLYVVFILSTAALLWAAYAIARTVRRHVRGGGGSMLNLRDEHARVDGEADADPAREPGAGAGSSKPRSGTTS